MNKLYQRNNLIILFATIILLVMVLSKSSLYNGDSVNDKKKSFYEIPKDKPLIYFAMGSSVNKSILKEVMASFKGMPYYIVSPMKFHLENEGFMPPENASKFIINKFGSNDDSKTQANAGRFYNGENK